MKIKPRRIGIIGGGPAGLFMYKRLVESDAENLHITIFEKKNQFGSGMPYSTEGAGKEHVTNVSDNEIPLLVTSVETWLQSAPKELYEPYNINPGNFNEYKVLPRLLFGHYLEAQFQLLHRSAQKKGITTMLFSETAVTDIVDEPFHETVYVTTDQEEALSFDAIIICTGHHWPKIHEGKTPNWFDSPYPPQKLQLQVNFPVAIKGASLSAVDAVRTLARANGTFTQKTDGSLKYEPNADSQEFRLVMHSLDGLLPALRFHLDDPLLHRHHTLGKEEIEQLKKDNNGFVPLDHLFEYSFKTPIRQYKPELHQRIQHMNLEEFVEDMMSFREALDPFTLFKAEYAEAQKSIDRKQSVYWKEMLAVLDYNVNYPAKHLSAEDMLRLKKVLMPLVSIIIAFVPQGSYHEFIALHSAGILSLVAVDRNSTVEPRATGGAFYTHANEQGDAVRTAYEMFVDATGQPSFMYPQFPFRGLVREGAISAAYIAFQSKEAGRAELEKGNSLVFTDSQTNYFLQVPGIQINDYFQVVDKYGVANNRIYIMAVPYISGLNPDFSGLDFCEEASERIADLLVAAHAQSTTQAL